MARVSWHGTVVAALALGLANPAAEGNEALNSRSSFECELTFIGGGLFGDEPIEDQTVREWR
jgi:hypothetical protein